MAAKSVCGCKSQKCQNVAGYFITDVSLLREVIFTNWLKIFFIFIFLYSKLTGSRIEPHLFNYKYFWQLMIGDYCSMDVEVSLYNSSCVY